MEKRRRIWDRLARWFNNVRLQMKFFLILLIALLLVFVGTRATSRLTDRAYNNALYERTIQLLNMFSQTIQVQLESHVDSSFTILTDNVLQDALSRMDGKRYGSNEWLEAKDVAVDRMLNISLHTRDVKSVLLHTPFGIDFVHSVTGNDIPKRDYQQYAEMARAAKGQEVWLKDPETENGIILIRDVREMKDLSLKSLGVLIMQVDLEKIVERSCKTLAGMGMPLHCAIDLHNVRAYSAHEGIPEWSGKTGDYVLHHTEDETLFCVRYQPKNSVWAYTAALPYDEIDRSIRWASGLSLIIAVLAMAVTLVLGSMLTASILRHFKRLIKKFQVFAEGKWQPEKHRDIYKDRRDEIGELHRRFDQMATEQQRMIEEIYVKQQQLLKAQLSLLEAQLRQLRAQIQPHFLYNTLESIYCLAKASGEQRIASMTGALGRMLRATLQDKRDVITLREDLVIAQEYLKIQTLRYEDKLCAELSIDEAYMDVHIPAMTLQPLVENAVRHGAEEMQDVCHIHVYCQDAGDYIDLVVEDDGPGMAEDTIERLERGEIKPDGLGIGLSNIHKRLKLAFQDEECGLRIRRQNGKTQVIVRAPGGKKDDQALIGG